MREEIILKLIFVSFLLDNVICIDLPIHVVEEWKKVECYLNPSLPLALVQNVCRHNVSWVVQSGTRHDGAVHVPNSNTNWGLEKYNYNLPVDIVSNQRGIQQYWEPFAGKEEENVDQAVQQILRKNKWVEACTLVYGVFVVRLQLIKSSYLNCKDKL